MKSLNNISTLTHLGYIFLVTVRSRNSTLWYMKQKVNRETERGATV